MRIFSSALIILVITFITLEAFSFAYWSIRWGKIQGAQNYYNGIYSVGSECPWSSWIAIHPFLALRYHRRPNCSAPGANIRGMFGDEIPDVKDPNFYHILILGGSVAEILFTSGELEKQLNQNFVSPNGKPFRIWNSAISAGAQPRQSIANLLYGESADLVVSLEGFNEHFSFKDQSRLENPPYPWYELEKLTTSNLTLNYIISSNVKKLAVKLARDPWLNHSFSLITLIDLTLIISRNSKDNVYEDVVPVAGNSREESQRKFIIEYSRYLKTMNAISRSRNQKLVVFLQPIPALFKPLTDSDRRVTQLDIGESYMKLVKAMTASVSHEVKLIPILDTFADYKDDLYVDLIHFLPDSKGNEWLARRMIKELSLVLNLKKNK